MNINIFSLKARHKKKIWYASLCVLVIFAVLMVRLGYVMIFCSEYYMQRADDLHERERSIKASRGKILDINGVVLASNKTVCTISVIHSQIKDSEEVIKMLCSELNLTDEEVRKRVTKVTSIERIKTNVDKETGDRIRNYGYDGVKVDEDYKRYYPYDTLASKVIGFTGSDNQGIVGLEVKYDSWLAGNSGKILTLTDARGVELEGMQENRNEPESGMDLTISIDYNIQTYAQQLANKALAEKQAKTVSIIVMNPNNGEIMAMVNAPEYNLNEPYELNYEPESIVTGEAYRNLLNGMWRNKCINDTYEPGSTFKLVTASTALQEGIVQTTDKEGEFCCVGYIDVAGTKMKCWRYYRPHGPESLRQALMNSCNPVFIGLGEKIGVAKYYEYLRKYGFLSKTGIDLPGEATGIFLAEKKVGPVELGTIAFGQRFEVTPIQMITMVSTIANGGTYIKPRVVKQIIDSKIGEVTNVEVEKKDRVISEETSKKMLSMMESVVAEGTGKNAQVKGYSIGGKTGTSEDGVNTGKYVTSFIGTAPISDPEVCILITLYNPTGEGGHQGGGVAAPIGSQVLGEVLPYLEIKKDNEQEEEKQEVEVPNIIGMTEKEAKKALEDVGLQLEFKKSEEKETITDQLPKAGIKTKSGTIIIAQ